MFRLIKLTFPGFVGLVVLAAIFSDRSEPELNRQRTAPANVAPYQPRATVHESVAVTEQPGPTARTATKPKRETFDDKLYALPPIEQAYAFAKMGGELVVIERLRGRWAGGSEGTIGVQEFGVEVQQLIESDAIIASYSTGSEYDYESVALSGIGTSSLVDGKSVTWRGAWIRQPNLSYTTVLGATRTIPHWKYIHTDRVEDLLAQKEQIEAAEKRAAAEEAAREREAARKAAAIAKYGFDVRHTEIEQVDQGMVLIFEQRSDLEGSDHYAVVGNVSCDEPIPAGVIFFTGYDRDEKRIAMSRVIEIRATPAGRERSVRATFKDVKKRDVRSVKAHYFESP